MSQSPFVYDINNPSDFEQHVIQASFKQLVLVDFWAPWCEPCKTLMPTLSKLAQEYAGTFTLIKINSDENQEMAMELGVRNLPTVFFYKDGQVVHTLNGALPEAEIKEQLNNFITNPCDEGIDAAFIALEQGQPDQALDILKELNKQEPNNFRVIIAIANVYLINKDLQLCKDLLDSLPDNIQSEDAYKSIRSQLDIALTVADAPELDDMLKQLENEPDNFSLRLQLSNTQIATQQYDDALENLFYVVQKGNDNEHSDSKAQMLKIFEILGGQGDIVRKYRQKLFSFLN